MRHLSVKGLLSGWSKAGSRNFICKQSRVQLRRASGFRPHKRACWSSFCFQRHQDRMRRLAMTRITAAVTMWNSATINSNKWTCAPALMNSNRFNVKRVVHTSNNLFRPHQSTTNETLRTSNTVRNFASAQRMGCQGT